MRPLLSLVMILKNESKSIKQVLEASLPHVDRWTILDTGSTDGTQDIIREVMAGKPGTLHDGPFVDFATARNRALDLEAVEEDHAVFSLMLSGDEHLQAGEVLRQHLEEYRDKRVDGKTVDLHWLKLVIRGATMFTPRVFRTGSDWRYEGVVHECPYNRVNDQAPMANVHGCGIVHVESDPEARYDAILELHIPLLVEALEKNPRDERALIFLAQSYESLLHGLDDEEQRAFAIKAMDLRKRRLNIPGGTDVERNYVLMHWLDDARIAGVFSDKELFGVAEKLVEKDPHRPETALLRAQLAMKCAPLQKVYEYAAHAAKVASAAHALDNSSPVDTSCEWRAHHLAAVAAKQLARKYPDDYSPLVREHMSAGMRSGGTWELFKVLIEPKPEAPPEAASGT